MDGIVDDTVAAAGSSGADRKQTENLSSADLCFVWNIAYGKPERQFCRPNGPFLMPERSIFSEQTSPEASAVQNIRCRVFHESKAASSIAGLRYRTEKSLHCRFSDTD